MANFDNQIALVQEDPYCREIMQLVLEEEGYQICPLQMFVPGKAQYALIIIDEYLSEKRGSEICKELKSGSCDVPVILSSTGMNLKSLAQSCHADAYLEKPFDIQHLRELVQSLYR